MEAASHVLVLFFLMTTGFLCAKLKITGPETTGNFTAFIIKLALPALLFSSFLRPFSAELLQEAAVVFGLSIAVYALSFFIAFIYPRFMMIKGPERGVHRYALIISNCGFIGYPMVEAILGPSYIFHAVIFNIPFSLLAFSICAWLIAREGERPLKLNWKIFLNRNVIATALGLIFFIFSISLPYPLHRAVRMLADITSPMSMIVIGMTLAQAKIWQVFGRWKVYVTVGFRLFLLPALAGIIFYFLGVRGPLYLLAVLITAMPAGSSTSILANLYSTAQEEAGSLVFLSTMLCMFTIPLVLFIAGIAA